MAKNEIEILNKCFLSAQNAELTVDHLIDELMPYALLYSGTIDAERYGRRYITTGKCITSSLQRHVEKNIVLVHFFSSIHLILFFLLQFKFSNRKYSVAGTIK